MRTKMLKKVSVYIDILPSPCYDLSPHPRSWIEVEGRHPMKTRVKELRAAAGLTQLQLGRLVHVSVRTINSIEKEANYSPSLMLAYRLAEVFGVTVEELCCLRENLELEDAERGDSRPA